MKRFIALLCSLALVVSMLFALTCCVNDDGQKLPDDPDSGEQTPGGDENEGDNKDDGVIDGGEIDLGGGEDNKDPENPENPDDPENPENPDDPDNPDDPENPTEPSIPDWRNDPASLTYEYYRDVMTPGERMEHFNLCEANGIDYFDWYIAAKQAYDDAHKPPEIDGDIDLGGGN